LHLFEPQVGIGKFAIGVHAVQGNKRAVS